MNARTYEHSGRQVEAMRFVGNGPDIAAWAGPVAQAFGTGLIGGLIVAGNRVACGDWVTKSAEVAEIVPQEQFVHGYREVRA